MPHGTTVYFQHPDESSWWEQLAKIEEILADFGSSSEEWEYHKEDTPKYRITVANGAGISSAEKGRSIVHDHCTIIECESVGSMPDESIIKIELQEGRLIRHPALTSAEIAPSRSKVKSLGVGFSYKPVPCADTMFNRSDSRGVWHCLLEVALDPNWAEFDVTGSPAYGYEEIWEYYHLIKRLHLDVGFSLTAGSFEENYYKFGECEGTRPGFDSLFRFDRNGPSRLIQPYEERRPFRLERDANGDNELSVDRQSGLYRCVVPAGQVR